LEGVKVFQDGGYNLIGQYLKESSCVSGIAGRGVLIARGFDAQGMQWDRNK
jgi:hypothetical protein